jgi:hypothetical protein
LAFHSEREADHSPPSSAEVKEWVELYLHSPIRLHGVVLSWGSTETTYLLSKGVVVPAMKQKLTRNFSSHQSLGCFVETDLIEF